MFVTEVAFELIHASKLTTGKPDLFMNVQHCPSAAAKIVACAVLQIAPSLAVVCE